MARANRVSAHKFRNWLWLAGIVVFLDQLSKWIALDAMFPEAVRPVPGQLGSGPGGRGQGGPPKDLR